MAIVRTADGRKIIPREDQEAIELALDKVGDIITTGNVTVGGTVNATGNLSADNVSGAGGGYFTNAGTAALSASQLTSGAHEVLGLWAASIAGDSTNASIISGFGGTNQFVVASAATFGVSAFDSRIRLAVLVRVSIPLCGDMWLPLLSTSI